MVDGSNISAPRIVFPEHDSEKDVWHVAGRTESMTAEKTYGTLVPTRPVETVDSDPDDNQLLPDPDKLSWELPAYLAEGSFLGNFVSMEVRWQIALQRCEWIKWVAIVMHWGLKEEGLFMILPFLVYMMTPRIALNGVMIIGISEVVNGLVKWAIAFPRPFWVYKDVQNKDNCWEGDYSTPSGHTQLITSMFTILCLDDKSNTGLWVGLSLVCITTGVCRVYTGVHYFHDIVGGWLLGVITAAVWSSADPLTVIYELNSTALQAGTLLASVFVPLLSFVLVRAATAGMPQDLLEQFEIQARSKMSMAAEPVACVNNPSATNYRIVPTTINSQLDMKWRIKTRNLIQYILPLSICSGLISGLIIAKQVGWAGYTEKCEWSAAWGNVARAFAGTGFQVIAFAITLVLPNVLLQLGVPEALCRILEYAAGMATSVWLFVWLQVSVDLGFPSCPVHLPWVTDAQKPDW